MGLKNIQTLAAIASGTLNVNVDRSPASLVSLASITRINGSVTLTGNLNISPSGTPIKNTAIKVLWEALVTITPASGNQVIIFGEIVPDELVGKNFIAECVYDGTAWVVNILPDFAGVGIVGADRLASDSVTTAKITDDSVTLAKMAGLAKGNIIYGDASGDPASVNLGAVDANLVVGDTTNGVAVVAMSGDATIIKTGALTIANSAVTTAKIADDAVTAAKLDDDSNRTQVVIPTSFESAGEIGVLEYKICFPCTLEAIHATVTKPFTSTGTHIFKDDTGTVITGSQIDMSSGLFLGNIVSTTPTANNTFVAGDVIKIETSVSAAVGGRSTIVLCMLKS
jgi:hypothetical protein